MHEIKWIKVNTNMFDDEKIKLIDAMEERDLILYIWMRLLIQCGKTNAEGYVYLNENMPFTANMLSTIFNRSIEQVKIALDTLKAFGMIDLDNSNMISIINWGKHQNIDVMEKVRNQSRKRVQEHRARKRESDLNKVGSCNGKESLSSFASKAIEDESSDDESAGKDETKTSDDKGCYDKSKTKGVAVNSFEAGNSVTINNTTITQGNRDVTLSNVTVTLEKEKKKREKEKEVEREYRDIKLDIDYKGELGPNTETTKVVESQSCLSNQSLSLGDKNNYDIDAGKIIKYYEMATGKVGSLNHAAVKVAIIDHGYENVKIAMSKALQQNKFNMTYICGILRNWRREGYPNREDEKNVPRRSNIKSEKEFGDFKPKKPRVLTSKQRLECTENLI